MAILVSGVVRALAVLRGRPAPWLAVCSMMAALHAVAAPQAVTLDLESALARALQRNRDLTIAMRQLQGANNSIRSARAEFSLRLLPASNVGFSQDNESWQYGLSVLRPILAGTEFRVGGRYSSVDSEDGAEENASVQETVIELGLDQPLFRNFGALVNGEGLVSSRQNLKSSLRNYEAARTLLVLRVIETYESILRAGRQIDTDKAFYERAGKLQEVTSAREQQGLASRVDMLRVELQKGQAEARLSTSREQKDVEMRNLAELLGDLPATDYALTPPPPLAIKMPPVEEAISIALSNRLDYAQAIQNQEDAQRGIRLAARRQYPDLRFVSRYSEPVDSSDDVDRDADWFVGFVAGSSYNPAFENVNYAQSILDRDTARDIAESVALTVTREVHQAVISYRSAGKDLEIKRGNYRLAKARADLAKELFDAGRGDHFSVTDGEDALAEAATDLVNAASGATVAGYRLLYTVGMLVPASPELLPAHAREQPVAADVSPLTPQDFRMPAVRLPLQRGDGGENPAP